MNRKRSLILFGIGLTLLVSVGIAYAQGPTGTSQPRAPRAALTTAFTYQGQLEQNGSAYNGACDLQFGLWDDASVGTQQGVTQTVTVNATNGLFTTPIDFGAGMFNGNRRWLAIAVRCPTATGSYTPLTMRQELTATPYALTAMNFSGALAGDVTGTQSATTVGKLQGRVVSSAPPTNGQVLQYNGAQWVPSIPYWSLTGNSGTTDGTNFLGTMDNVTLTLRAYNQVGWRLAPSGGTPNVIGGVSTNWVTSGVQGATIGGGGTTTYPNNVTDNGGVVGGGSLNQAGDNAGTTSDKPNATVSGGFWNTASGGYATVGGGYGNTASGAGAFVGGGGYDGTNPGGNQAIGNASTIGGGYFNRIPVTGTYATVGGGISNTASGYAATIPGGYYNSATMSYTLAAGQRAKANHQGTFVWADSTATDFASTANNQFLIRAGGGVGIATNNPQDALEVNGIIRVDVLGGAGSTQLCRNALNQISICASSIRYKNNVANLNLGLDTIAKLRPVTFNWKDTGQADLGFVAEEVNQVTPLLTTLNDQGQIEGVKYDRITAILTKGMQEQQQQIADLKAQNASLEARVTALEQAAQVNNAGTHSDNAGNVAMIVIGALLGIVVVQKPWRRGEQ